jgi:hypothetical protein
MDDDAENGVGMPAAGTVVHRSTSGTIWVSALDTEYAGEPRRRVSFHEHCRIRMYCAALCGSFSRCRR